MINHHFSVRYLYEKFNTTNVELVRYKVKWWHQEKREINKYALNILQERHNGLLKIGFLPSCDSTLENSKKLWYILTQA